MDVAAAALMRGRVHQGARLGGHQRTHTQTAVTVVTAYSPQLYQSSNLIGQFTTHSQTYFGLQ